ncbi:MFS transporter [Thermoflavimicrobium daqui]|uniref:Major facilitator superfamily (MFS) profile domain-containing protein n=1 Tax=Thermoflavimicrobium daqui TaxID=2137476 RepID=A0A364K4K9_9BACL|nr:MFS transporter [Thermoflavimicrobium daqui]RAL24231.1 hypothetical protein DL897_11165 [Thermoflavimicrobium daqui]
MNWGAFTALRHRDFALLWSGQTLSHLGDNVFRVAFVWYVVTTTGSANATAIAFIAFLIPNLLMMLFAGAIVDRMSRRTILLYSDLIRAVMAFALAILALSNQPSFVLVITIYIIFGLADAFFQPAYMVIVKELIPEEMLLQANSLNSIGRQSAVIGGPILGALVVEFFGMAAAFMVNGLSFVISALTLLFIRYSYVAQSPTEKSTNGEEEKVGLLAEIKEGLRYVFSIQWLWIIIAIAAVANAIVSGVIDVGLSFLVLGPMKSGAGVLGLIFTLTGVGALLGGLMVGHIDLNRLRRRGVITFIAIALMGVSLLLMGLFPSLVLVATMAVLYGISFQVFGVIWVTTLQETVPQHLLGRVGSVDSLGSYCMMPVGLAVTGVAVTAFGVEVTFICGGLIVLVSAILGLLSSSVRSLGMKETTLSDRAETASKT